MTPDTDTTTGDENSGTDRFETVQVGDRVDVCLHGATRPNHAKATVVDTDPVTVAKDQIKVELDESYRGCGNPYTIPRASVNGYLTEGEQ